MVKILRAAIALTVFGATWHSVAGDPTSALIPTKNIPLEIREAAAGVVAASKQTAQELIESGEMDWLETIRSQVNLAENPLAEPVAEDARPQAPTTATPDPSKHPLGDGFKTFIFVSWSMGEPAIRGILQRYEGDQTTAVVFRGVPDEQPFAQGVMAIQALSMSSKSDLTVLLDPVAFKTHGITAVPSVAIETPDGKTLIKASGTDSVERLQVAIEDGKTGNLGALGPTDDISEPDLIEVAQQRIEALDFDQMKERAISRFWHKHTGHFLPTATEDKQRRVDPTIMVHQDILDAAGNVVTPRGEINPLEIMPFDQKLVIIDPDQPWQVELAASEIKSTRASITVTVMATRIDPDRGWDLFESTQNQIDAPLYLLSPDMAQRFQIEKTPSIVTADTQNFIVTEISKTTAEEYLNGI